MGLAFIPLYIKYLGMEAYGLIGFYAVLQAGLSLVDAGMTPTMSREMARYTGGGHSAQSIRDLLRSLEICGACIALLYALLVWASSEWLAVNWLKAEKLPVETVAHALAIMGMVTALRMLEGFYRGAIFGLQKQVLFNIANTFIVTFRNLGAVLILAFASPTIQAYFVWQGLSSFLALLVFSLIVYRSLPVAERGGRFSAPELTKVWRFAAGILATSFLVLLLTQVDKLILSRLLSLESFGQYNLAATVANSLLILVGPITQAHYPKLTEMLSICDNNEASKVFHRGAQLISVIVGAAACVIFYFGDNLIVTWTANEEIGRNAGKILKVLTLGTLLNSFMHMPYMLQLAFGWSSFAAKINFVAVLFLIPAILILTPIYGAIGAAWVWVILNAGYVFIATHVMFKTIMPSEKGKWFIDDLFKPFLATFTTVSIYWLLIPDFTNKIYETLFVVLAGLTAVMAAIFFSSELKANLHLILKASNRLGGHTCSQNPQK